MYFKGTGQRKITTMHALDALFLYGKDVRKIHFIERSVCLVSYSSLKF
jgi:hypothetical protein